MSLSYWMIVGLGLSMKELFPYLQASKVRQRLREQEGVDLNTEDAALWEKINDTERFKLLLEHLADDGFQFADLIAQSDGRHLLSYANDGETTRIYITNRRTPGSVKKRNSEQRKKPKNNQQYSDALCRRPGDAQGYSGFNR